MNLPVEGRRAGDRGHHVRLLRTDSAPRVAAVVVAVVAAVAFAVCYWFFICTASGQLVDDAVFDAAGQARRFVSSAIGVLDTVSVVSVSVAVIIIIAIAFARRRPGIAVGAAVVVIGSHVSTQVLKHDVLHRPYLVSPRYSNSFPSGHTTIAVAVSVALLIAVPVALRGLVAALGVVASMAVGTSTVIMQWHRPSDLVGAAFVGLFWAAAVIAVGGRRVSASSVRRRDGSGQYGSHRHRSRGSWPMGAADGLPATGWVLGVVAVAGLLVGVAVLVMALRGDPSPRMTALGAMTGVLGVISAVFFVVVGLLAWTGRRR